MKTKIKTNIVLALFLLVLFIQISFAATESIENIYHTQELTLKDDAKQGDFTSWSCQSTLARTATIFINDCYCISLNGNNGIGYGNVLSCINENATATLDYANPTNMNIDIVYSSQASISEVTLTSADSPITRSSEITCSVSSSTNRELYTFYDVNSGEVYYRGSKDTIQLVDTSIEAGSEIACQVSHYRGADLLGYRASTQTLNIVDSSVLATNAFIAPAYPKVNQDVYCYGFSEYSISSGNVTHTFEFYANDILVNSTTFNDTDTSSSETYTGVHRNVNSYGDVLRCEYTVSHNNSGTIITDTFVSSNIIVANSKPSLPTVSFLWNIVQPTGSATNAYYNQDAVKIAEFTSTGDVRLAGYCFASTDCNGDIYSYGDISIDEYGNLCVPTGCSPSTTCLAQNVTISNGTDITLSYGDTFCYTGNIFEGDFLGVRNYSVSNVNGNVSVNGTCGSSDGSSLSDAPTSGFCSEGTYSEIDSWNWECLGENGGNDAICSASQVITEPDNLPSVSFVTLLPLSLSASTTLPSNIITMFNVTCLSAICENITYRLVLDDSFDMGGTLYLVGNETNNSIAFGTLNKSTNLSTLGNEYLYLGYNVNSTFGVLNRSVYVEASYNGNLLNRSDIIDMSFLTPAASCYDNIRNQDETGVDCGGICGGTCYDTCEYIPHGDTCENGGTPISSCWDLNKFTNEGYGGSYYLDGGEKYCLRDDMYCGDTIHDNIGSTFVGELDGRGCTIDSFTGDSLFEVVGVKDEGSVQRGAVIKNINFVNADVSDTGIVGIIAGKIDDSVVVSVGSTYYPVEFSNINFTDSQVSSDGGYVGMLAGYFGWMGNSIGFEQSNISNVNIINGSVSGRNHVGAISGYTAGTNIENVFSSATVTGTTTNVGGIVGEVYIAGQITNLVSIGNVSGYRYVGGIIGQADADCCGDIDIMNSYATGDVTADFDVGGLVGELTGDAKVQDSWSSGLVTAVVSATDVGGLIGDFIGSLASATDSYYNTETSGQSDNDGRGEPKTSAQMTQQATYSGWDFTNTWRFVSGADYPCLRWQTDEMCLANNN